MSDEITITGVPVEVETTATVVLDLKGDVWPRVSDEQIEEEAGKRGFDVFMLKNDRSNLHEIVMEMRDCFDWMELPEELGDLWARTEAWAKEQTHDPSPR